MIFLKLSFFLSISGIFFYLQGYEGDGRQPIMLECNTKDFYDSTQTKITFYGDSRMDFVNKGGVYGNSTMPSILNEPYGNAGAYSADQLFSDAQIQNLGVEGYRSYNLTDHLDRCIPQMSKNYKIAKRFVFHIGGNNFADSLTVSWHATDNLSKTAHGRSILPVVLAVYFEVTRFNLRNQLEYILMNLKAIASKTNNGKPDVLVIGGYPARGRFLNITQNFTPQIIPGLDNPFVDKVKMTDPLAFYLSLGEYFSVGLASMEADYSELASRHNLEYLRVWDEMNKPQEYMALDLIHPNDKGFKKWGSVVGKKLREISFNSAPTARSFTSTGDRWKDAEMEYILARADLQEKLIDYENKKKELEDREKRLKEIQAEIRDAEYKLSLIKQRIEKVDGQIADTKAKIEDLNSKIEEARLQGRLEEERRLAELKRQEEERLAQLELERRQAEAARLEQERQNAVLAAQQAEAARLAEIARQQAEAARLAAEAAQRREQAAKAEQERLQRERDALALAAACFFFGYCHL